MYEIQEILFDRHIWSNGGVFDWLIDHDNFYPIKKIGISKRYYSIILNKPKKNKKHRSKNIGNGIKFILEY